MLDGGRTAPKHAQTPNHVTPGARFSARPKSFHCMNEKKEINTMSNVCALCSGQHALYQCKQYGNQTPKERSEYIQSKGFCFNYLSSNHTVRGCHSSMCCRRCGRRHHTTLHIERVSQSESTNSNIEEAQNSSVTGQQRKESATRAATHFTKENQYNRVLLATARVKVTSPNGYSLIVRALIDQGSEASFMSEDIAQSLGLKRVKVNGIVSGVGEGVTRTKHMVLFKLESLHNSEFSTPVNAYILKNLSSYLPSQESFVSNWRDLERLPLADPSYGKPARIDVILGAEMYGEIITKGLLRHPSCNGPITQNTHLGWILSGRVMSQSPPENQHVFSLHVQLKEDDILKQFWEIEREPETIEKKRTREEIRCEEIFQETTKRDEEGRYIVRLPFKLAQPECLKGKTKEIALKRFNYLERKLLENPILQIGYTEAIEDYVEQNHMEKITSEDQLNDPNVVYLPHHAVIREDKETTKIRPVFDASCKGVNNVSLNDEFLVGPKLQQDLRHILIRWRCHPICIVADLVKMYRQVRVHKSDADFQRILWRKNPKRQIESYRLLRLTVGTARAPYLAVRCLQQLARDEEDKYPVAAKITLKDYYMDDQLTGCETDEDAVKIYDEMNKLMKAGGFELQKWCTNSEKLLTHIKEEKHRSESTVVLKSNDTTKVLGISWNKNTDEFEYTFNLPDDEAKTTKRRVLSDIARIYDPIGWIAPIVVSAKIFIQKLWKSELSWDDELPSELIQEWLTFRGDMSDAKNITIPRWLNTSKGDHIELHVFADASQDAYAAVVYLKCRDNRGNVTVNLVTAKTKVASVEKQISIPRMELCAALLAAQLVHEVSQVMEIPKKNIFAWTDSSVVLAWIAKEPSRWTVFVSNRVSDILTMLDRQQWNHVRTNDNPADCASRGVSFATLIEHRLWWHGPKWLQNETLQTLPNNFETTEEERPRKALTALNAAVAPEENSVWNRFSNLDKMLRVLSYCRRILNFRLKREERKSYSKIVTANEVEETLLCCIKKIQSLYFKEEIKLLKAHGSVTNKSPLHTLCPFIDKQNILRVGGRIHEAQVEYDKRHPIIMPNESHLTKLIIDGAHIKTLHGGPQIMLNYLRSKYWIIRARDSVKKCFRNCVVCVRYSKQSNNPLMGRLPQTRATPTRPFKISGVDFTGFVNVRFSPGRGSKSYKAYICLFVCLFSKAIHLEAVSDLTSKGFIAAFRRFVSRRGHCKEMYSDNGTNFVGADKELKDMFDRAKSEIPHEISHLLANEGTNWKFIPPHAPNFGGLWEASVRSTKTHLKRVIGDSTLTFEELSTVLTQIEACLNSRLTRT